MGDKSKLHVCFAEVSLPLYTRKLVEKGYKVCVVDQVDEEFLKD
jgi:hypothetical protein